MKFFISTIILLMLSQDTSRIIYDFTKAKNVNDWYVVNDGVMGGLSKGKLTKNYDGHAVFEGYVTTENNGGFTSVRYPFYTLDVSKYKAVKIKLKGDGKPYQFRIKEKENQRHSYIQEFDTSGDWETITIPFESFYPSFRGRKLDMSNYSGKTMEEVTFLIGNKKKESFQLEIERIYLE